MANTYVNKVQLADGTTLIDISSDTVTADKILNGYTAHSASGAGITGNIGTATANVTGTNSMYAYSTITETNVTLSDAENNGIAVDVRTRGSGIASVTATTKNVGYAGTNMQLGVGSIESNQVDTTMTKYISAVTLAKPSSGTRSFSITVPNGGSKTVTFVFTTDSTGNVTITES